MEPRVQKSLDFVQRKSAVLLCKSAQYGHPNSEQAIALGVLPRACLEEALEEDRGLRIGQRFQLRFRVRLAK
jgi:hypothetical protein